MDIAIVKEIKPGEGRVALLPIHIKELTSKHNILVESNAGKLSGADDDDYRQAGASIIDSARTIYERGELILKVKEIMPEEFEYLCSSHIIFTNLHSAADPKQLDQLLNRKLTSIAAEEIHQFGSPNCPLAGEIGALEGLRLTFACHGGSGRHFFSHFDAPACKAVVIGLGGVGQGALRTLLGLGVEVSGFDAYPGTLFKTKLNWPTPNFDVQDLDQLETALVDADMIVNCVLWDKTRNDHLIDRKMLKSLKPSCVIVDIACDTNGAIETCRPTSWHEPVYEVDGIRHFCVDNIPGATPVTASQGYGNALLPYVKEIASHGVIEAIKRNPNLAKGVTTFNGHLTLEQTAQVQQREYISFEEILKTTRFDNNSTSGST